MSQKSFNRVASTMFWVLVAVVGVYTVAEPIYRNGISHLKGKLPELVCCAVDDEGRDRPRLARQEPR